MQTSMRTFGNLSQDEIFKKHIDEEKSKEWKEYKTLVIGDILKKYNIVPGEGKYNTVSD